MSAYQVRRGKEGKRYNRFSDAEKAGYDHYASSLNPRPPGSKVIERWRFLGQAQKQIHINAAQAPPAPALPAAVAPPTGHPGTDIAQADNVGQAESSSQARQPPGDNDTPNVVESPDSDMGILDCDDEENEVIETGKREIGVLAENANWKFVKTIYKREAGNKIWESSNSVYVELGDNQEIRDRIVLKHTMWTREDSDDEGLADRDRMWEIIHRISTFPRLKGLQRIRGCSKRDHADRGDEDYRYGLYQYIDWAPGKSLEKLFRNYNEKTQDRQIPETFIWTVFFNIATVLHYILTGNPWDKDSDATKNAEFEALVHRDLKPPNIFLSDPQEPYDSYPNPELGDWDLALEIARIDPGIEAGGTPGWMAPENPPEEKTDIWALGLIIWELMNSSLGDTTRERIRISETALPGTYSPGENPRASNVGLNNKLEEEPL
ncbi:hypothetical protein P280DRAFT_512891 [Massarina eburnea CBS 473.64]|uniref:non-specific serine/threonine protein kinase n=1 Tax=Massarina eburnea CBS 473.64 TaxID=1395130 RepID=A0A6A6SGS1_9PLEO|nr:hypothetical protein P280DRAFT_512891 [Massarina eburnea CBS 473.64]